MDVEFWCPACEVDRIGFYGVNELYDFLYGIARHLFCAIGAGIDMAVKARLVASIAQINLNGFNLFALDSGKVS